MTKAGDRPTMKVLTEAKKAGQFPRLLEGLHESVNLMASGETRDPIHVVAGRHGREVEGHPVASTSRWPRAIAPGRRASRCPKSIKGTKKADLAYEFVQLFLDGLAGAYLNRQGYYSAVLETAKSKMRALRVGLLDGGPVGRARHQGPRGTFAREGRRQARRRLLRRPHGRRRLLERPSG